MPRYLIVRLIIQTLAFLGTIGTNETSFLTEIAINDDRGRTLRITVEDWV